MQSGSRADVSYALFPNDPQEYCGGELVVNFSFDRKEFKLSAGSIVLYSSRYPHCVQKVIEGQRIAAIGWAQSLVRDPFHRSILAQLRECTEFLANNDPDSPIFRKIASVEALLMHNLDGAD